MAEGINNELEFEKLIKDMVERMKTEEEKQRESVLKNTIV